MTTDFTQQRVDADSLRPCTAVHLKTLRPMAAVGTRVALAAGEELTLSDEIDYQLLAEDALGNVELKMGGLCNEYGMPDLLQFWSVEDNVASATR